MSKKGSKESKLSKYLKAPIRFLIKAGNFYIKSMTEYSDRVGYGTVMGCPTGQVNTLPRSYSVSSTKSGNGNEDFRELMRAASTRNLDNNKAASTRNLDNNNKVQLEPIRRQQVARQSPKMPRSQSVGIGRIDEDKPCDFEQDVIRVKPDSFPRSKSSSVIFRKF